MTTVRVTLPPHLRRLSGTGPELNLEVDADGEGGPTLAHVLDALEEAHPVLRGTIRDHGRGGRRPLIRFFACGEDLSHASVTRPLPDEVRAGAEPLHVVGAIAGG